MAPAVSTLAPATPSAASVEQPLAATIPPELLMLIFDAVQDQTRFSQAQHERIRQALVCRSWFFARVKRNEFFVHGDAQAAALLEAFGRDPARAAQVSKLELSDVREATLALMRACVTVVDVELNTYGSLSTELIAAIPASVRRLKLNFDAGEEDNFIPDFSSLPDHTALGLVFSWYNRTPNETARVAKAIAPVLGRVTELALLSDSEEGRRTERAFLMPLIPKMTSLRCFEVQMWQVDAASLAETIAQLDKLEQLRIGHSGDKEHAVGFTAEVAAKIIEKAGPMVNYFGVDHRVVGLTIGAGWKSADIRALEKAAAKRSIKLEIMIDEEDFIDFSDEEEEDGVPDESETFSLDSGESEAEEDDE